MPADVRIAKEGSIFTVTPDGGATLEFLGKFKTAEIRVRQDLLETSGPLDDFEYKKPRRQGSTITTTNFIVDVDIVAPCPPASAGSSLALVVPPSGWVCGDAIPGATVLLIVTDLVDGGTWSGYYYISDMGESMSDDPNEESITFDSAGPHSYDP